MAVEALRSAGIDGSQVAAVGITNQRETTVIWDRRTGDPVANAIVWQDRRTADACEELRRAGAEQRVRAATGLLLDPYFSGTKIAWILEHVAGARERAEAGELAFGTVDSWLAFRLTGGRLHVTDATNASRTLLYDIHAGDWDDELLDLLGVPRALLPEVRGSSAVYGEITGIDDLAGVPLAGIAGDQQSALMGQLCTERGSVKTTYGTGCFALLHTGTAPQPSERGLLTTIACSTDGQPRYALEGSVFTGGAVVRWLRDGLGLIGSAEEVEALAASVPDSGGVVLVPAFTGLGVPHWDPHARGTIVGMTLGTGAGHVARAASGGDRLPGRRAAGRAGRGRGSRTGGDEGRRRGGAQRPADAVPGRRERAARGAARGHRVDGAGRRLPGRPGGRVLAGSRGAGRELAGGAALRAGAVRGPGGRVARIVGAGGRAGRQLGR